MSSVVASSVRTPRPVQSSASRLLTVKELAVALKVTPDYIYRHQRDLGAFRLPGGDGGQGRLRFDLTRTLALMDAGNVRSSGERSLDWDQPAAPGGRPVRPPPFAGTGAPLLPVRRRNDA